MAPPEAARGSGIDFTRDVQPILSENCYQCHGPDANKRKAELRLDTKEGAFRTKDDVTVIVPGKSGESELVARIFSDDPEEVMPSPKSKRKLSPEQKELLKRWVDQGAPWAEHWAFVAPARPPVPQPGNAAWLRNPIDSFIGARWEKEAISPSPEAPKEKLLRRVTLDLTGLPPTAAELDAFLQDNSADAYEKAVDRLLASPRYGERMVWEWLDAARYADTNGYQGDPTRPMWYWRDWVIKALNENMPFDRFTVEQLAGDLLPEPTREQLVATGFHRNHMINGEGGRIAEESRVEYVQDRVETTGTVWLGLTMNCCRCHDHKFDPLAQKEYYQLAAFFNSIDESGGNDAGGLANPTLSFATPKQEQQVSDLKAKEADAKKQRDDLEKKLGEQQEQWEQALIGGEQPGQTREPTWHLLVPDEVFSDKGTQLGKDAEGSVIATGPTPAADDYVLTVNAKLGAITAFKLVAEPDNSLVNNGPGRADNGNFVLTELTLQGAGKPVDLAAVSADFEQTGSPAKAVFDGDQKTGWAIMPEFNKAHTLLFEARSQVGYGGNEVLLSFRLSFQFGRQHTLGKFKLYATTDSPALLRPMPDKVRAALVKPIAQRSDPEKQEVTKYYFDTNPELAAAKEQQEKARKTRETAEKAVPRTMVMRERDKPRDTFILVRGAYNQFAEKVTPGVPAVLPKLPADAPPHRLALANWIVSPEHPLTARVTVNRYWQLFFGTGLVKTVDDFGVQGDKPSHPELLDWLAREFIESGWNVKRLHRLIVTSATYRQSSRLQSGMAERDPENRLLARGPRHRLPSWMLRDQALAIGGLLVEKVGGAPVKVYQPDGVWEDATFGQIKYAQDQGEALYRRSLYVFWRRIIGPTFFFDVASRQNCLVKVARTNTPLHALVTLNDVAYTEAARALAQRMLNEGGANDEQRIGFAFCLCTSRRPAESEQPIVLAALDRFRQQYRVDPEAAKKLISIGESKADAKLDPVELAAHTSLASLLLNLDETLTKE